MAALPFQTNPPTEARTGKGSEQPAFHAEQPASPARGRVPSARRGAGDAESAHRPGCARPSIFQELVSFVLTDLKNAPSVKMQDQHDGDNFQQAESPSLGAQAYPFYFG